MTCVAFSKYVDHAWLYTGLTTDVAHLDMRKHKGEESIGSNRSCSLFYINLNQKSIQVQIFVYYKVIRFGLITHETSDAR